MSDWKSKPFWQLVETIVEEGGSRREYDDVLMLNLAIGQYRALMSLKASLCQLKEHKIDISKAQCVVMGVGLGTNAPLRARDLCVGADLARIKHAFTDHAHHSHQHPDIHVKWYAFVELYKRVARSPSGIEDLDGSPDPDAAPAQDECNGCVTGYGPHTHVAQSAEEPPPGSFSARAQEHYERVTSLFVRQNQAVVESLQKDNLALREQLEKLEKQRWEDLRTLEETLDAKRRLEDQAAEVEVEEDEDEDESAVALTLADAIADDARARLVLAERDKLVAVTNAKKADTQQSLATSLITMLPAVIQQVTKKMAPRDFAMLDVVRALMPTFDESQFAAILPHLTLEQISALLELYTAYRDETAEQVRAAKSGKGKSTTGGPHEVPGQRTEFSPPAATTAAEAELEPSINNVILFLGGEAGHGSRPEPWSTIRPELLLALDPANQRKLQRLSPVGSVSARIASVRDLFESIDVAGLEGERLALLTERHPELAKLFEPLVAAFWGKSKSD